MPQPRILFFGTPEFAIPTLNTLYQKGFTIVGIITAPDEPAGRKQQLTPPPIKIEAQKLNLPIFQPKKLVEEDWKKTMPIADIFIIVAYGKILPQWLLSLPQFGTININPSLLPKYRGPSPIQSALLAGEKITGVSIMLIDKEVDHGPILGFEQVAINTVDDAVSLSEKLAHTGAEVLCQILPEWTSKSLKPIEQDHSKATFTAMVTKDSGHIDWSQNASQIINQLRAFALWPKCWAMLENESQKTRIIILKAHESSTPSNTVQPGSIVVNENKLLIATGNTYLIIDNLQPENKKEMPASAFLQGYQLNTTSRFI